MAKEFWKEDNYCVAKEKMVPVTIKAMENVENAEELLKGKYAAISFRSDDSAKFMCKGAYVVLDYGKELCGGLRFLTRQAKGLAEFRITFGESLMECCANLGDKNAGNDHSPRDFEVKIPFMSDLTFGQSGFRFARVELLSEEPVLVKNIYAVNTLPYFEREALIKTSDEELNKIIDTAIYTLKLNLQNGLILDGIKRDRLVWSGDLHQEIVNSVYLYGDNSNITNSLTFLKQETPATKWINTFPSYSAWWVINLCDYCRLTGNRNYFEENRTYAEDVLKHFDECIDEDGTMNLTGTGMPYFLDWPTCKTEDAVVGTAAIIILAAKKYMEVLTLLGLSDGSQAVCDAVIGKLEKYLDMPCEYKQTRAFQILAGKCAKGESTFLEKDGATGFSTFMAYYILTADAMAGGKQMLSIIKEYFGAMLSRGATTFWEDFHMEWLEGSGRIDEWPKEDEKDIHGDYGDFCYLGFRHSLCHGWASGVLAFVIEYMLGLQMRDGGKTYEVHPNSLGVDEIYAKIPVADGWLEIVVHGENVSAQMI